MAAIYDVSSHPLLSEEAKAAAASDPVGFVAQNEVAEDVLGLRESAYAAGTEERRAVLNAVAWQVNYQYATGVDAWTLKSKSEGSRSESFRDALPGAYPPSVRIIAGLPKPEPEHRRGSGWTTVTSLRSRAR